MNSMLFTKKTPWMVDEDAIDEHNKRVNYYKKMTKSMNYLDETIVNFE